MFDKLLKLTDKKEILGLTGELKGLYLYNYFKEKKENVVVVTQSLYEANILYQTLINYTNEVILFPMDDFLTSEALASSPELKTVRLETLSKINLLSPKIIITNLMGYLRFLPSIDIYEKSIINIKANEEFPLEKLRELLFEIGYTKESIVNKTGEIAIRGYVVDIFPLNNLNPIRLEYWGDTIDKIKIFDVDTQLSIKEIEEISILPNTEFLTCNNKNIDFSLIKQKNLANYISVKNISTLIPSTVFFNNYTDLCASYKKLLQEIFDYNVSLEIDTSTKYMNDFYDIKNNKEYHFETFDNAIDGEYLNYGGRNIESLGLNMENLKNKITEISKKKTVVFCLNNKDKTKKIVDVLDNGILTDELNIYPNKINIIVKKINKGFIFENYVVVCENDLSSKNSLEYKYNSNFRIGTRIKDISGLNIGDFVVHSMYGIGKYLGIKSLVKNGIKKDYLFLEYRGNDKLYVPVEKIDFVHKYSSNEGSTPLLNKLNSNEWEKTKLKVKKKIESIASELIQLYAARESIVGFAFDKDNSMQKEFENNFIYEETKDQIKVIKEIKKDMESIHPMDRLLCGDVGYGKTEVAFRAIFKAILSGKQVAFLCPTTILSSQHYQNAVNRFNNFPVTIELLNRFVSSSKVNEIKTRLKEGKIDLLIGTHRLLSDDIIYKDLGLLVIDEEQRFGVKHKEKIKQYKNSIDVLTLSATPIPRTLQMSMSGVRGLSLIETPPVNRYPIQTYVFAENKQIVKDAIYKELSRNGQVFILYNRVEDMESKKAELESLVPNARIVMAHGRMSKYELEDVMNAFINGEFDILLCTTIIETGIDIPRVNTLIIYNADYFGLSQLYQIRGRVGRSNKIAYAYLMYNKDKSLNETAVKRLNAIKEFTELGSGFKIAMRDLSIRGAGDILGSEQAGFVASVGIDLFLEMLKEEIDKQKGENKEVVKYSQPLIEVDTTIGDDITNEEEIKIEIHKKINAIDSISKLEDVKNEIIDRFGKITNEIDVYMHEELFEKMAEQLGINNIIQTKNDVTLIIKEDLYKNLKVTDLFINASNISRNFRFKMQGKNLLINLKFAGLEKHFVYYLIDLLKLFDYTNN